MKSIYLSLVLLGLPIAATAAKPPPSPSMDQRVAVLEALVVTLQAELAAQSELLEGVSRLEDPYTEQDTLRFEGMNVQIVNDDTETNSDDGTGNLIIGFNEPRDEDNPSGCPDGFYCNRRGGSHNLIVGMFNNYTSYGGVVIGSQNEISQGFASVTGGGANIASGVFASVSGGIGNTAEGPAGASVSGGNSNTASGLSATVGGGALKEAEGDYCWEGDSTEDC